MKFIPARQYMFNLLTNKNCGHFASAFHSSYIAFAIKILKYIRIDLIIQNTMLQYI